MAKPTADAGPRSYSGATQRLSVAESGTAGAALRSDFVHIGDRAVTDPEQRMSVNQCSGSRRSTRQPITQQRERAARDSDRSSRRSFGAAVIRSVGRSQRRSFGASVVRGVGRSGRRSFGASFVRGVGQSPH